MSFRPALVDPQGGPITGKEGGPMSLAKPAINWSHVTGKRHSEAKATNTSLASHSFRERSMPDVDFSIP